jgi:hypothetical protein
LDSPRCSSDVAPLPLSQPSHACPRPQATLSAAPFCACFSPISRPATCFWAVQKVAPALSLSPAALARESAGNTSACRLCRGGEGGALVGAIKGDVHALLRAENDTYFLVDVCPFIGAALLFSIGSRTCSYAPAQWWHGVPWPKP